MLDWLDKKICLLIDQGKDIEKLLKGSDALNLRLLNIWKHKTKPLDEQPDHCIDYVTNLLDQFGSVI
ncbi:MAG: hypothetical protein Q4B28_05250 [bacterium]|nr:hypothetical protein [bacterium]